MAARFWVGGGGPWAGTGHWATSTGGASGATEPTSADTVTFDALSGLNVGGTVTISATAACGGCTISGITSSLVFFSLSGNPTWSAGTYSFQGNSQSQSVLFQSNTLGTQRTLTINGTHGTHTDVHFQDIAIAGTAGTLTGTRIGDCLGNSGITATVSAQQTWSGTTGGNWSVNAWTSRVPLPQDDVVISSAFAASQTVTIDIPRLGRSINWTGATGAPVWSLVNSITGGAWIFGSLTLATGMTTSSNNATPTFGARSAQTITSNGVAFTGALTISAFGGTITLQDALTIGASSVFQLNAGTFTDNGKNVSIGQFQSGSNATKVLNMTGTWSVVRTGTNTGWSTGGSALTINAAGSIIDFTQTDSGVTRTFAGGGFTYGTLRLRGTGSGALIITGNNTFTGLDLECTTARTITCPAGGTQIVQVLTTFAGASGQLLSFVSSTPGTSTTIQATNSLNTLSFFSLSADVILNQENGSYRMFTGAANTQYTCSAWVKGASGTARISLWGNVLGKQSSSPVTLTNTPQRISVTATTGAASTQWAVFVETASAGLTFNVDGVQVEAKPIATPYVNTSTATASRSAARIQEPSSLLNTTQGWAVARLMMGFTSSASTPGIGIFSLDDGTVNNRISLVGTATSSGQWETRRVSGGVAGSQAAIVSNWTTGGLVTAILRWNATTIALSINGSAFSSNSVANSNTFAPSTLNVGSANAGSSPLDGDVIWFATGTGTLADADATTINGFGSTIPAISQFPGAALLTAIMSGIGTPNLTLTTP